MHLTTVEPRAGVLELLPVQGVDRHPTSEILITGMHDRFTPLSTTNLQTTVVWLQFVSS